MTKEELKKSIHDKEQRLKACMDESSNAMNAENEKLMKELEANISELQEKLNQD